MVVGSHIKLSRLLGVSYQGTKFGVSLYFSLNVFVSPSHLQHLLGFTCGQNKQKLNFWFSFLQFAKSDAVDGIQFNIFCFAGFIFFTHKLLHNIRNTWHHTNGCDVLLVLWSMQVLHASKRRTWHGHKQNVATKVKLTDIRNQHYSSW